MTTRTRLLLLAVLAGSLVVGLASAAFREDRWQVLMATGDRLAAAGGRTATPVGPLSARGAYLLAFHEAHDSLDLPRMRAAAGRIAQLGEPALARDLLRVADETAGALSE